jgi:DNA polymerase III subunit delta
MVLRPAALPGLVRGRAGHRVAIGEAAGSGGGPGCGRPWLRRWALAAAAGPGCGGWCFMISDVCPSHGGAGVRDGGGWCSAGLSGRPGGWCFVISDVCPSHGGAGVRDGGDSQPAPWHASVMATQAARRGLGTGQTGRSPVTVIVGEEQLLVERAVAEVVAAVTRSVQGVDGSAGAADESHGATSGPAQAGGGLESGADVHDVSGAELSAGELSMLTSPSLFGGDCVVVVRAAQDASSAVAAELAQLAGAMPPDVTLVITHSGAVKGKSLLAALASAGARRVDCRAIRRFGERMDFLRAELARFGRKADDGALRSLIDAVGTDLRDLAAACDQLASDTTDVITAQVVARYFRGKAEASGFSVADRALEGNLPEALAQLRWALAIGTAPVLITSALARGIRTLGQVGTSRGKGADALAAQLGMPAWKIDKVREQLRGWTPDGLARAHSAVAQADADVKGEGASAGYALERAIRVIVASRAAGN